MEELLKAISLVLEWHDENLSDGVNREYAIRELRQAYETAQQSFAADMANAICPHCGRLNKVHCGCNELA